ncbi:MAG: TetR/AcrR family transcriptional regulator [Sphingomonas bacterium]|nr:TetR/AcrR family transcriptional regulator [Sphingomonas bacterium]
MTDVLALPARTRNVRGRAAHAAVLAAATRLFAERGYNGTTIADVAAEAGVAKPSVLYHYPDKDALWTAAVEALWAEVEAFFEAKWPRTLAPSRALLETTLDLFVEAAVRWPAYVRIPFIEGATPSWRSAWLADRHFTTHVQTNDRILRAMQRRGQLGPGDPAHYQAIMTSSINVLVSQSAMWNRTFERPLDDLKALKALARLTIDLLVPEVSDQLVK